MTVQQNVRLVLAAAAGLPPRPGEARIIAVDGRSAAGKTTLSAALADALGAGVVHMDDFFLPAALRTAERLAEPGGNVHYERFAAEVLPRLRSTEAFCYRRFDCKTMAPGARVAVAAGDWRIVEGAYSCHPRFGAYMDLRLFADVAPEEQLARVRQRGGEQAEHAFRTRWIPLEEAYLAAWPIRAQAQLILE
ncbi:MAG: uridine kinase [Gemmiger sp.]